MDRTVFFDQYYTKASIHSIIIMNLKGIIQDVNSAFTQNFGFESEDLKDQPFDLLFTLADRKTEKPSRELREVIKSGQADDEIYILNKWGDELWCSGESILISETDGESFIVKSIVNLHSKKQMQLLLLNTEDILAKIFQHTSQIAMIVLSANLKVVKTNQTFIQLFKLHTPPSEGSKVYDIGHPFWQESDIKVALFNALIEDQPFRRKPFTLPFSTGNQEVFIDSKIIEPSSGASKLIYLLIYEAADPY